ncbi:MAG: hypothetical protein Q9213_007640 [Squamulea squamosa]
MGYGFSLFKNPSDHCNLSLGAMAVARIKDVLGQRQADPSIQHAPQDIELPTTKVNQELESQPTITGVGWVRLLHDSNVWEDIRPRHLFSPSFLEQASMAFSNVREHRRGFSRSDTDLFAEPMTRNKLHTACAIVMILQKQYVDLTEKNPKLPRWPHNQRQFHAARYRRRQEYILHVVTDSSLARLRRLAGINPSWPRDKRLIRLKHILKTGPKEFLVDFRAVVHVGFGTRNAEKIRQRMLLDSAFTLWLCGIWLWTSPITNSKESLPDRPALPTRTVNWITFIRQTYGDESDVGQRWAKIPASEEGRSLAESCYYIVKAAAAKNWRSIYNDPKADVDRLLWCLRVIREETFMCPDLEGQTGDDTDEVMLFLD